MLVTIKTLSGMSVTIEIEASDTIKRLKENINEKEGFEANQYRLFFGGKVLNDDKTCSDYDMKEGSTIILNVPLRRIDE